MDGLIDIKAKRNLYRKLKKHWPKHIEQLLRNIYDIYLDRFLYKKMLIKCVEKQNPDIIYERLTYFHCASRCVAKRYNLPYIIEIHTPLSIIPVQSWKKLAQKIYLNNSKSADAIIVISTVLKKELHNYGIPPNKIHVIPNAADTNLLNNIDKNVCALKKKYELENKIVIGFVGSMEIYHGVDFFIEAAGMLSKKFNHLKYILIGPFPKKHEKERIQNLINMNNLCNEVIIVGTVPHDEVNNYISAIDICVLPSRDNWYGSPIKLFEYGIMKKPIVSSRFLPIEEIFEGNKNILFFEPGNVDDFIDKIIKLVDDPIKRKKLGEGAYRKVVNFHTWDKNADKIIEICNDIILKREKNWKQENDNRDSRRIGFWKNFIS